MVARTPGKKKSIHHFHRIIILYTVHQLHLNYISYEILSQNKIILFDATIKKSALIKIQIDSFIESCHYIRIIPLTYAGVNCHSKSNCVILNSCYLLIVIDTSNKNTVFPNQIMHCCIDSYWHP